MKVLCVIPARYASTRLPGKPLALIAGKPMIQHVYMKACEAKLPDDVIVATDNEKVFETVHGFGGRAIMTSPDHPSGTDRLAEVALNFPDVDVIVNVQGDEPMIPPLLEIRCASEIPTRFPQACQLNHLSPHQWVQADNPSAPEVALARRNQKNR